MTAQLAVETGSLVQFRSQLVYALPCPIVTCYRTGTTFALLKLVSSLLFKKFLLCKDDDEKKKVIHMVQPILSQAIVTEDDHITQRKLQYTFK